MAISLKSTVAAPVAAYPALKPSIVLFDCNPGTRSWTVPEGVSKIRAFVVGGGSGATASIGGAGGGYSEKLIAVTPGQVISYTVADGGVAGGSARGGTSSFGGVISASGGSTSTAGAGVGGDINTAGGAPNVSSSGAGAGAGHAFGDGQTGSSSGFGGGFSSIESSYVDGWKIGLLPGEGGYGLGGVGATRLAGMGGGSSSSYIKAGIGGGATSTARAGGTGLVGIEVIA